MFNNNFAGLPFFIHNIIQFFFFNEFIFLDFERNAPYMNIKLYCLLVSATSFLRMLCYHLISG